MKSRIIQEAGSLSKTLTLRRGRCFYFASWASTPSIASKATVPRFFIMYNLTAGRVKLKLYKMKKLVFTAFVVGLCLTAKLWAQVPSYVPTSGLVGWWPFNGNANDESGNGNNGTVNGATLTSDRFGNVGKSYSFNGVNQNITKNNFSINSGSLSISFWFKASNINKTMRIITHNWNNSQSSFSTHIDQKSSVYGYLGAVTKDMNNTQYPVWTSTIINNSDWYFVTLTSNGSIIKFYLNGNLIDSKNTPNLKSSTNTMFFGGDISFPFEGKLDDIGIWNRALTQIEVTDLYKSCGHEITSEPINSSLNAGSNAYFSVSAVSGSTYQWQSNPLNMGWQNISNNSNYSGVTSNSLSVDNTTVSNHNQPFRAIVSSGTCIDTSNIATIQIADTCITNVTIYDTLLTTVTDTLIINTTLSLPAPNNANTIKVYPNPASDHITIDNGNYSAMAGYSIKITNNAGQQVFQSAINQQQFYVDLSMWNGNGLYFVHLFDPQNNTVTVRKIVLQ